MRQAPRLIVRIITGLLQVILIAGNIMIFLMVYLQVCLAIKKAVTMIFVNKRYVLVTRIAVTFHGIYHVVEFRDKVIKRTIILSMGVRHLSYAVNLLMHPNLKVFQGLKLLNLLMEKRELPKQNHK